MDFAAEINDLLSQTERVVSDPLKFKKSLKIGDDAFVYLNNAKNTVDFIEALGFGAGAGGLAFFAWSSSLGVLGKLAVLIGITTTPYGWIIGVGMLGAVGALGLKKITKKVIKALEEKTVEKIPKFINTPLDLIGMNIASILTPPALWMANSDGNICDNEKNAIINHFVNIWGFDRSYIQSYLETQDGKISNFNLDGFCELIKGIVNNSKELNWDSVSEAILNIMKDVMTADGIEEESELAELKRFRASLKSAK